MLYELPLTRNPRTEDLEDFYNKAKVTDQGFVRNSDGNIESIIISTTLPDKQVEDLARSYLHTFGGISVLPSKYKPLVQTPVQTVIAPSQPLCTPVSLREVIELAE